jgi:hypothetical protein
MKKLIQISLLFMLVTSAIAQNSQTHRSENANVETAFAQDSSAAKEKVLRVYDWKDLNAQQLPGSEIIQMDGISVLKIENTNKVPLTISVLTIADPSLIAKADAISCEMKYNGVGYGLVEKTNFLGSPPGATPAHTFSYTYFPVVSADLTLLRYFQPEAAGGDEITNTTHYILDGTSNWKPYRFLTGRASGFQPDISTGNTPWKDLPIKLELKLSLPTNGTVYLRPIKLLGAAKTFNSWWLPQQAGLLGGIGGALIGCFGGLIGLLASKGKARNFVLGAVKFFIALGILLIITGLVAMALKQPYAVWYALLLPGVILVLVFSLNLHSIQRRYDELEIRRMTSIDTMGS